MTLFELCSSVKKKYITVNYDELDFDSLSVQITDLCGYSFYISYSNKKIDIQAYAYDDHDVLIQGSQRTIEQLFTKKQYLFTAYLEKELSIDGSFSSVMKFQKILNLIIKDSACTVYENVIRDLIHNQYDLKNDLGIIMQSLQVLLTNSIMDLPFDYTDKLKDSVEAGNLSKYKEGDIFPLGVWKDKSIEWIILKKDESRMLVLSKDILEKRCFHFENQKISWKKTDIYKWLNTDFYYSAFTNAEKEIISNRNRNPSAPLFLLKKNEVESFSEKITRCDCNWWTSSTFEYEDGKRYVASNTGKIRNVGVNSNNCNTGVRVAMYVEL